MSKAKSQAPSAAGPAKAESGGGEKVALSALYYPHTQIRDLDFLKASLLTWDDVSFIQPYAGFTLERSKSALANTALDLLCKPVEPHDADKSRVHQRLLDLLKNGVPPWLQTSIVPAELRSARPVREYRDANDMGIYPRKLAPETWELLRAAELVTLGDDERQIYAAPLMGFLLMSLLADSCAGETRQKITDRIDAYSFLWKVAAAEAGAQYLPMTQSSVDGMQSRLVTMSIKVVDSDDIPLKNIVAMRQREAASSSAHEYRAMRRRYAAAIQRHAHRLVSEAKTAADWIDIERQFELELSDDLATLRSELKLAKTQLAFSKEVGVSLVAAAWMFAEPVSGVLLANVVKAIGWGAIVSDVLKFSGAYKSALAGHPTSWLYLNARPVRDILRDL